MANNGPLPNYQQQQQRTTQYHCKECGVYFDSAQSLDVHLQYHKENLLTKWANQATQQQLTNGGNNEEANNNTTKIKREFPNSLSIAAPADSSDTINKSNKSPDSCNSTTPDIPVSASGHPATPQSFHSSASSPYQQQSQNTTPASATEPANFSPTFHNFHHNTSNSNNPSSIKTEESSSIQQMVANPPSNQSGYSNFSNMQYSDSPYFNTDPHLYSTTHHVDYKQSHHLGNSYRYHPYTPSFERNNLNNAQVTSSSNLSPSYIGQNTQPTPSPSPKQCDKCGFVCETAGQLIEHLQIAHPSTPFNHHSSPFHFPGTNNSTVEGKLKQEDEPQAEILDLDSQKVHVYQTPEEQEDALKRQQAELASMNGSNHNPHSVSAMLSWPQQQQKIFANNSDPRMFHNGPPGPGPGDPSKMYDEKIYSQDQKLFQPHQMHNSDFHPNNVTTTTQDNTMVGQSQNMTPQVPHPYRPYEHIPVQPNPPVISSTQVQNPLQASPAAGLPASTKGANWKSNEARRPKTYNCSACNKWFTSSGHLKRHYNTTLHKNAVKSSGQPDPATLPISVHHHPTRDPNHHSHRRQSTAQQPQQNNQHQQVIQQQNQAQQQSHDVNSQSPVPMHLTTSGDDTNSDENPLGVLPASYDSRGQHSDLLQQPPSGPYDRHPPNIQSGNSGMHLSPNLSSSSLTNLSSGSPPNGEAGPSANNIELSRGLQQSITNQHNSISHTALSSMHQPITHPHTNPQSSHQLPPFNLINQSHMHPGTAAIHHLSSPNPPIFHPMAPPSQISTNYPNELSPHVTQTMLVTNSQPLVSISQTSTGEYVHHDSYMIYTSPQQQEQPLPSFAQFALLAGIQNPVQISNVGGSGSVTDPLTSTHYSSQPLLYVSADSQEAPQSPECILPDVMDEEDKDRQEANFSPNAHIIYRSMPTETMIKMEVADYDHTDESQPNDDGIFFNQQDVTVLQPVDQNIPHDKVHFVYMPVNNNILADEMHLDINSEMNEVQITSPSKNQNENDLETSSPLITSTGSPLAAKKQTQKLVQNSGANNIHKCIDCDKIFNKACYLTQHNKTFHSGDKPFKCNRCGKRFSDDLCYQSHLKKHAGEKPHKCEQCPKQFNHKTDLRRHMCLHSGYKPYICNTCGKGFIRKDHMIKHCDTHMRKSRIKESSTATSVVHSNNAQNVVC